MKSIFIISILFIFSNIVFSKDLFDAEEYDIKFSSDNINMTKLENINNIKIKTFNSIIRKILTTKNYETISSNIDLIFVNNFILNMTINNEKIINNNYSSKIKINFNKNLIIDYLIKNEINYNFYLPDKLLLIVYEKNEVEKKLFSKNNSFYKYILNSDNIKFNNYYLVPNLDINDRFIMNDIKFDENLINKVNKLNKKYKTKNQILLYTEFKNNLYHINVFLFDENEQIPVLQKKIKKINYYELFLDIYSATLDKWKELNEINTKKINTINCKININNIYELSYVRKLLEKNIIIKNLNLNSISLNKNIYNIIYYGNLRVFKKSLENSRLNLFFQNKECIIKLT